ncbi:MAG: M20 family metallopeptidase [Candidatus Bathyarchaeota archaeon]|nr:M20 family metallopeptidase [Candidatus Bathyarchaeota archaeon]
MNEKERVLSTIEEGDAIRLLRKLVQIPSRNPPGEERELAETVAAWLKDEGVDATLVPEPYAHRPQVVATIRGDEGRPTLVLNGHLDVVPLGAVERWSINPFGGEVKAGRLYGRGSCDMKGGLTAMMLAAKAITESGHRLRGNLLLHFAVGEETSEPGTKTLLLDKGYTGDWGIVLEPTNLKVVTAEKGLLWVDVEIRGKPAHASTPELGINPIEKAADFITRLRAYREKIGEKQHPLLGGAVCSVTMIEAGIKENVVPGSCKVTLDRRLLPGEDLGEVEAEIQAILSQIKQQDETFEGTISRRGEGFDAAEIPVDSYIAQVVKEAVKNVTGKIPQPSGAAYGTDARNFINDAHIPTIVFGPGDPAEAHTYDESIAISQVVVCSQILTLTSLKLLA